MTSNYNTEANSIYSKQGRWPCSDCRHIRFVSKIRYLILSVHTDICKWSDRFCCIRTSPLCMGYCGNDVGVSTCAGDAALQYRSVMNGKMETHHLPIQTLALSSRSVELCCIRQTQLRNRLMTITTFTGLHCAARGLAHLQSSDWWEHVFLETTDDERWRANFIMCCRISVRLCNHLALISSISTFHWGEQYPWSDTKGTLISNLNNQSVQTKDAPVEIRLEWQYKPPHHVVWI